MIFSITFWSKQPHCGPHWIYWNGDKRREKFQNIFFCQCHTGLEWASNWWQNFLLDSLRSNGRCPISISLALQCVIPGLFCVLAASETHHQSTCPDEDIGWTYLSFSSLRPCSLWGSRGRKLSPRLAGLETKSRAPAFGKTKTACWAWG